MNAKHLRLLVLSAVMLGALAFAACGGGDDDEETQPTPLPIPTTPIQLDSTATPVPIVVLPIAAPVVVRPTTTRVPATPTPQPTATPEPTATPDPLGDFFLDIEEPAGLEAIVESATFTVVGRTRLDAVVSVNDTFAEVDIDGRFRVLLILEEPVNIIEVVASLSSGEELVEIIIVVVSP